MGIEGGSRGDLLLACVLAIWVRKILGVLDKNCAPLVCACIEESYCDSARRSRQ